MAVYNTQAIVLSSKSFGEADRILTLLTYERGKSKVIARGARRPKNRLAAIVQPLSHIEVQILEGNQLDTLNQGQLINSFRFLREDLDKMSYAFYLCELFETATEGATELRDYFILLLTALELLQNFENLSLTRIFIEVKLILLQGYAPSLSNCYSCNRPLILPLNSDWFFEPDDGGIRCGQCSHTHSAIVMCNATLTFWNAVIRNDSRWLIQQKPEMKTLDDMRRILNGSLQVAFGGLPKSAVFLQTLSNLKAPTE
jgi:DNA repair protein RecO (recombination protein O)